MNFSSNIEFTHIVLKLNENFAMTILPVSIFVGIESLVGFFGNILIIYVYGKFYTNTNFRCFVLCLAIYDLTSCLTTLPGEVYTQMNWYTFKYDWLCKLKSYFNVFTAWGSAFTLLLLSFDRCRKTTWPLAKQIRPSLAFKLCVSGIILSAIVSIPVTILWGRQFDTIETNNVSMDISICEKSDAYADQIYPFLYINCVYNIPVGAMMLAICLLNVILMRSLLSYKYPFETMSERETVNNSSTDRSENGQTPESTTTTFTSDVNFSSTPMNVASVSPELSTGSAVSSPPRSQFDKSIHVDSVVSNENATATNKCLKGNSGSTVLNRKCKSVMRSDDSERTKTKRRVASVKRRALTTIILSSAFVITITLYITLITLVSQKDNILKRLPSNEKAVFLFFLRLYFVNSAINPILYGLADPRFRNGLKKLFPCKISRNSEFAQYSESQITSPKA